MVTLKHPAFGDRVTRDVDPEDVPRWVASGWLAYDSGGRLPDSGAVVTNTTGEPERTVRPKPGPKRRTKTPSVGDGEA